MDTIKSELSSEDEMHPLDIEPQFVDMKHEEFSEPFVAIDKFEAEDDPLQGDKLSLAKEGQLVLCDSSVDKQLKAGKYICRLCGKEFSSKCKFAKHMMTHTGEKPFPCEACGKRFVDREHWKRHFRVHSGERPFQCSICKKQFTDNSILKTHSRIHTTDKSYTCTACCKVFSTNWDLKKHCRIHTGEKPYRCKVCGKGFSRNDYLQKHSVIHTGKKSFGCEICNKNFTLKEGLQRHSRIHTGEKSFDCAVCSKRFFRRELIERHVKFCTVKAANTVHPQLQKIKFQFSGLDKENTIMLEEITLKEANLKFMEQRNRIMKEIISEKKMKLQKERDVLDNLQNSVFQEKRQLCSRVREFSNKYGLLATMKKHSDLALQHKRWLNTSEGTCIHAAEDDCQLESVLAAIEAELCDVDSKLEVSRLHLTSLQEERLHLLHTPNNEQKLHEIQDLKNQTELLEVQCEAVQQELGWQYLILKQAANV